MAKMKEVGFARFDLGLPGNLAPVGDEGLSGPSGAVRRRGEGGRLGRFSTLRKRRGDRLLRLFYARGGAAADLGRRAEADRILLPMLAAFDRNDFEERSPATNRSKNWKSWDGAAFGYEGYLADNYYALLAVVARDRVLRTLYGGGR